MTTVTLEGLLVCRDADDAALVAELLPTHIALTRAEAGCLSFVVVATDDPLVWSVSERFSDPASFRSHQARVASSEWGAATASIERRYVVTGLDD
ncbi:antibiotic biosynthesis monooxygenase [Microbacterium sp. X-17]|uniref:putative quinol monooxygenase n=1 Tax=Microbacterium sp. X-17 TaxID=3144404 RepID=UPI0031F5A207